MGSPIAVKDEAAPAYGAAALTLHDTDELTNYSRWLYVGGTGNLKVTTIDGSVVTFSSIPAGTLLPIRVKLAWSTGSTATNVVALF
jgi:hypothetical protein